MNILLNRGGSRGGAARFCVKMRFTVRNEESVDLNRNRKKHAKVLARTAFA